MPEEIVTIKNYFTKLGLEPEIADIYIALHFYGPQSVSELSRSSGVERTRIYRLVDSLAASELIEVESHYKRNIYKAAPIENVQILLVKKEQELQELRADLSNIKNFFTSHQQESSTRVQFYHGADGAKQLFWNEANAKGEMVCILYENMQNKTYGNFFDRWVRRCNERNIKFRGIIGDVFINSQREWYATRHNERLKNWEARYVSDDIFKITHSMVTYNDVSAFYNWKDREVYGFEIYSTDVAQAQRQFFELLWEKAMPVNDLTGVKNN